LNFDSGITATAPTNFETNGNELRVGGNNTLDGSTFDATGTAGTFYITANANWNIRETDTFNGTTIENHGTITFATSPLMVGSITAPNGILENFGAGVIQVQNGVAATVSDYSFLQNGTAGIGVSSYSSYATSTQSLSVTSTFINSISGGSLNAYNYGSTMSFSVTITSPNAGLMASNTAINLLSGKLVTVGTGGDLSTTNCTINFTNFNSFGTSTISGLWNSNSDVIGFLPGYGSISAATLHGDSDWTLTNDTINVALASAIPNATTYTTTGTFTISGCTLNESLVPSTSLTGHDTDLPFIFGSTVTGTFSTVNAIPGVTLDYSQPGEVCLVW